MWSAYQTEKLLEEHGDKLTDDEKKQITDKVEELRKMLGEDASAADLNAARDEVMKASQILGQKIYEASAAEAAAAAESDEAPSGDDVVEAEIVDEDEEA